MPSISNDADIARQCATGDSDHPLEITQEMQEVMDANWTALQEIQEMMATRKSPCSRSQEQSDS
jgi:hypothetical protein